MVNTVLLVLVGIRPRRRYHPEAHPFLLDGHCRAIDAHILVLVSLNCPRKLLLTSSTISLSPTT